MRKVVVTEEMVRSWGILHREARWTPKKPYCKLCSTVSKYKQKCKINYFDIRETVYRVDYPNGTYGLYHIACMEDPKKAWTVENILRMDKD